MNDRLGRFGKHELTALTALCTLLFGCFGTDSALSYRTGNWIYASTGAALLLTWLFLESGVRLLNRSGAQSLGALLAVLPKGLAVPAAALLALSMLLSCILPELRLLRAMTGFVYTHANAANVALYLIPGMLVLPWLGMETLTRTGRILLPATILVTAAALLSDIPLYRVYRLYPLPNDAWEFLCQSAIGLLRFVPVTLLLLTTARGAQGHRNVLSAGRRGLLIGGVLTLVTELCLALSYRYTELQTLSAPLYRLLVELESDSAAVRLDRVVLFVWTMANVFAAACQVYGAALLLAEAFGVRDVRPLAVQIGTIDVIGLLCLHASDTAGMPILVSLYRFGWLAAALPAVGIALFCRRRKEIVCPKSA